MEKHAKRIPISKRQILERRCLLPPHTSILPPQQRGLQGAVSSSSSNPSSISIRCLRRVVVKNKASSLVVLPIICLARCERSRVVPRFLSCLSFGTHPPGAIFGQNDTHNPMACGIVVWTRLLLAQPETTTLRSNRATTHVDLALF